MPSSRICASGCVGGLPATGAAPRGDDTCRCFARRCLRVNRVPGNPRGCLATLALLAPRRFPCDPLLLSVTPSFRPYAPLTSAPLFLSFATPLQRLFAYYSDALEGIFTFYATSDKRSNAALAASAVKAGHVSGPYAASHGAMTVGGKSPSRATRSANTMKEVRRPRCAAMPVL
jgi:hypothetical protein